MSKHLSRRHLFYAAVPLLIGIGLSILISQLSDERNLAFQVRFNLAWLLGAVGFLLSALGGLWVLSRAMLKQQLAQVQQTSEQHHTAQNREFLRRLDHELKNPLTIIRLGLLNLQEEALSKSQKASLVRIGHQSDRLRQLVIDLRRLTELETAVVETAAVDVTDVLQEAIALATEALEHPKEVMLIVQQAPWPISKVQGDRELLIIAFSNLIDNGLKYTAESDQVEVRANDNGQQVIIEVADSGMGIPDDEVTHVFENLFRGEQARGIAGSGLGLPLVERIVKLHNGHIEVRSRNQTGTVFSVQFPIHQPE